MNARRLLILLVLVAIVGTLVGTTTAQEPKIPTIIFTQEPDSLNPMYSGMWFAGITQELYLTPPWTFDADLNPNPVLVTEIPSVANGGLSADGTVITLHLRDDITWSDGEPITSADFLFTYEMIMADDNLPQSRYPYDTVVESVEAPDDLTVVITFIEPFAPWTTTIFDYVLPEHALRPVFEDEGTLDEADWNRAPNPGVGPFIFEEWESGSHFSFVANENYFDGAPLLDGIFFRIVPDDASQVAALINGDGDIGTFMSYADMPQLEAAGIEMIMTPSGYNEHWRFNLDPETAHPAMLDINVRQALVLAAPRQLIVDELLEGRTYVAGTFWEGTPFDNPDIEPLPYDLEEAARLLDEAGWVDTNGDGTRDKDGVELVLRYLTPPRQVRMDTQVIVQQSFAEVGIGLILENPGYDVFWNSYGDDGPVSRGRYDIAQYSSTSNFPDPDTSQFMCSEIANEENPEGLNDMGYCEEDVDALFQEQARTVDYDARVAIFHQIGALMEEDLVWVGMWYDPDWWAISPRLLNVVLNGADPFWNCQEWDLAQ